MLSTKKKIIYIERQKKKKKSCAHLLALKILYFWLCSRCRMHVHVFVRKGLCELNSHTLTETCVHAKQNGVFKL